MDRTNKIYWAIIIILLGCSVFFILKIQDKGAKLLKASGKLQNGDIVRLHKVIDGDTIIVTKNLEDQIVVRIVGIKALDEGMKSDEITPYAKSALVALENLASERPVRVLLHPTNKDKYGRVLATIFSGDQDIALMLISRGLAIVYTKYPFPVMSLYLQQQAMARANSLGLWASKTATTRADAMIRKWQEEAQ
ncbi:MAG: thermonuclease family protein [Nitrospirae bacterium]|nr:thermonuclease family protein [Nitrospirota bacterium]